MNFCFGDVKCEDLKGPKMEISIRQLDIQVGEGIRVKI